MIKLFGEIYYIDFEELDEFIAMGSDDNEKTVELIEKLDSDAEPYEAERITKEHLKHKEINGVKFELIRNFIADIGDEPDEGDATLGGHMLEKTSIRFKIAFNTLVAYNILKILK